jgi:sporulation protein YlmC with PRC-barrel domain
VDFFSGISRYALAARTPFVCFDERIKFSSLKEYEINDLCGKKVPKEYIFGFSTIIESGDKASWSSNLIDHLLVKLDKVYEKMDRDSWPSSSETNDIVPYDSVRKIKNKKLGSRFIKINRD